MDFKLAFSKSDWKRRSKNLYNEKIVKFDYLNSIILWINKLAIILYSSVAGLTLMSKSTKNWADIYEKFTSKHNVKDTEEKQPLYILKYLSSTQFVLPPKIHLIYIFTLTIQIFWVSRYVIIYYLIARSPEIEENNFEVKIVCTKLLRGLNQERLLPLTGAELTKEYRKLYSHELDNKIKPCNRLKEYDFQRWIDNNFGGFQLWNSSATLENYPILHDWIFPELQPSIQLFAEEIRLTAPAVTLYIIVCGAASGFLLNRNPSDIPALMFLFEPRLIAFKIHARINFYLNIMRESYLNLWTNKRLDSIYRLTHRPNMTMMKLSNKEQPFENLVDGIGLSYHQFRHYLPGARCQSWRRIIMISHPIIFYLVFFNSLVIVMYVFFQRIYSNIYTININRELALALQANLDSNTSQATTTSSLNVTSGLAEEKTRSCSSSESERNGQFYDALISTLLSYIKNEMPKVFDRMIGRKLQNTFNSNQSTSLVSQEQILVNSFSPLDVIEVEQWIIVFLNIVNLATLVAVHVTYLVITILDLSLWLVELRMKLNISISIMKEYKIHERRSLAKRSQATYEEREDNLKSRFDCYLPLDRQQQASTYPTDQLNDNEISLCTLDLDEVYLYLLSNLTTKMRICDEHAKRLVKLDGRSAESFKKTTESFLISTYLDIRLFQDEIGLYRRHMNFLISFGVFEGLNLIFVSSTPKDTPTRIGVIFLAFIISNFVLLLTGFFQSQCAKLHNPIYSILAASVQDDYKIHHLALLWQKYLLDLTGSRSQFAFKAYSFKITYATCLQFNLSLASLLILTGGTPKF